MTAVVGFIDKDKSYIAADSQVTDWILKEDMSDSKIFKFNNFLLGASGKLKVINAIENWTAPDRGRNETLDTYIRSTVKKSLRELFEREEIAGISDGVLKNTGSDILIVTDEHVYILGGDFSIYRLYRNYASIGSGCMVCNGALAFYNEYEDKLKDVKIEDVLKQAIVIASQQVTGINDNIKVLSRSKK